MEYITPENTADKYRKKQKRFLIITIIITTITFNTQ